ncbi:hypothetical protein [Streptomyces sp. NPDC002851]
MKNIRMATAGLIVAAVLAGAAPAQAAEAPQRVTVATSTANPGAAVQASPKTVLKWLDYSRSKKKNLPLRLGYYKKKGKKMVGSGWTKIKKRHNIQKYRIVSWLAKSPKINPQGNKRYRLTGWAHRIRCTSGNCKVVSRIPMRLVTDETRIPSGGHPGSSAYYGVLTAYCDYGDKAKLKCPTWVNTKFKPRSAVGAYKAGESYKFTYKPLKTVKGRLVTAS